MAWGVPRTWVPGELPTAAYFNAMRDNFNALVPTLGIVDTSQTTTSTTYVDLATVGPSVTLTIGAAGILVVWFTLQQSCSSAAGITLATLALSGANTLAANDLASLTFKSVGAGDQAQYGTVQTVTGLAAGSTTVKLQYRTTAGTGTFLRRRMTVVAF